MEHFSKQCILTLYANQRKSTNLIYKKDINNPNLSLLNCGILIMNFSLGISMFYFDGIYNKGFIFIIFFLIFGYIINILSFILYIKCCVYELSFSYATLWTNSIGKYFSWLPDFFITFCYFPFTLNYYHEATYLIQEILNYINNYIYIPSIFSNILIILYIYLAIPSLLINYAKEINGLVVISWIKLICLILLITIHLYECFQIKYKEKTFSISNNVQISMKGQSIENIFGLIFSICFTGQQPIVEHVIQVMKTPTFERTTTVYFNSTLISFLISCFVSILSTLFFGRDTIKNSIIELYDPSSIAVLAKTIFLLYILMTMFFWEWVEARHFSQIFTGTWELSKWMDCKKIPNFLSCLIIIVLNISGSFFPSLPTKIFKTIGAIGTISVCLTFPSIFFLKYYKLRNARIIWGIVAVVLIIIGIASMILLIL